MAASDAKAFYDQGAGEPSTAYISPADAKGAIDVIYADMPSVTGLVASGDITEIVVLTDAEYAALDPKVATTLYITTG